MRDIVVDIADRHTGVTEEKLISVYDDWEPSRVEYEDNDIYVTASKRDISPEELGEFRYNNEFEANICIENVAGWARNKDNFADAISFGNIRQFEKATGIEHLLYGLSSDFSMATIKKDDEKYYVKVNQYIKSKDEEISYYCTSDNADDILKFLEKIGYQPLPSINQDNILSEVEPSLSDLNENTVYTGNYSLSYENEFSDHLMKETGPEGLKSILDEIENSGSMSAVPGNNAIIKVGNYPLLLSYFTSDGIDRGDSHVNPTTVENRSPLLNEVLEQVNTSQFKM